MAWAKGEGNRGSTGVYNGGRVASPMWGTNLAGNIRILTVRIPDIKWDLKPCDSFQNTAEALKVNKTTMPRSAIMK